MKPIRILLIALLFTGCITTSSHRQTAAIPILWASHLDGDFSFSENYQLVDTTHYYYTMTTDDPQTPDTLWHIQVERLSSDTVICFTDMCGGIYTTMHIRIVKNRCFPLIKLISPAPGCNHIFPCTGGSLEIDRTCWQQGILKAAYQFTFFDSEINQPFTRKGKIYAKIEDRGL